MSVGDQVQQNSYFYSQTVLLYLIISRKQKSDLQSTLKLKNCVIGLKKCPYA